MAKDFGKHLHPIIQHLRNILLHKYGTFKQASIYSGISYLSLRQYLFGHRRPDYVKLDLLLRKFGYRLEIVPLTNRRPGYDVLPDSFDNEP